MTPDQAEDDALRVQYANTKMKTLRKAMGSSYISDTGDHWHASTSWATHYPHAADKIAFRTFGAIQRTIVKDTPPGATAPHFVSRYKFNLGNDPYNAKIGVSDVQARFTGVRVTQFNTIILEWENEFQRIDPWVEVKRVFRVAVFSPTVNPEISEIWDHPDHKPYMLTQVAEHLRTPSDVHRGLVGYKPGPITHQAIFPRTHADEHRDLWHSLWMEWNLGDPFWMLGEPPKPTAWESPLDPAVPADSHLIDGEPIFMVEGVPEELHSHFSPELNPHGASWMPEPPPWAEPPPTKIIEVEIHDGKVDPVASPLTRSESEFWDSVQSQFDYLFGDDPDKVQAAVTSEGLTFPVRNWRPTAAGMLVASVVDLDGLDGTYEEFEVTQTAAAKIFEAALVDRLKSIGVTRAMVEAQQMHQTRNADRMKAGLMVEAPPRKWSDVVSSRRSTMTTMITIP